MQKTKKRINKRKSNKRLKDILYFFPIIFIIIIVPLITRGKVIKLPLEEADFWRGGIIHFDFSSYYKSIFLTAATSVAVISFICLRLNNKISIQKEKKYYIPMIVYSTFVILSTILSQNKHVATIGFIEMYQGVYVLLSYIILTFLLINYVNEEKDIKIIAYSFVVIVIAEGLIGVGEYFGLDFFQTSLGKWLITPANMKGLELKFTSGKHSIFGTLYNSNFVGSFGALVLPLSTALCLSVSDKKRSIIFGVTAIFAFATWLGCNSRAGYLGISVAFLIGIIVYRKVIKLQYKKVIFLFSCFIVISITFNTLSSGRVFNQFVKLNPVTEAEIIEHIQDSQVVRFKELSVKKNTFTIRTEKETLIGIVDNMELRFEDELGNHLDTNINNDGYISFNDEKYKEYLFLIQPENSSQIHSKIYNRDWDLYITPDEQNIKVLSFNDKLTEPIEAPRIKFFDGKETFASNRGYIWSRTIPMLKNTIMVGYGPDNFPMVFPHEDYIGKFNIGNNYFSHLVVDKPHNLYLQIAINTGVVSLLSLLVIWGIYLIDCISIYIKGNIHSFSEYIGCAIFLSITAYLVAGLFNDSIVSVAPLFWILLGLGISTNRIIRNKVDYSI